MGKKNMNSHWIDLYISTKNSLQTLVKKIVEKPLWKNIIRKILSDNLKSQIQKLRWKNCCKNSVEITWRKKNSGKAQWKNWEIKLERKNVYS